MRKGALVLAALMIAATPSVALAAKSAKKKAEAPVVQKDPNAAGKKFVTEAFSQPYYAWQSFWKQTSGAVAQPAAVKTAKKK